MYDNMNPLNDNNNDNDNKNYSTNDKNNNNNNKNNNNNTGINNQTDNNTIINKQRIDDDDQRDTYEIEKKTWKGYFYYRVRNSTITRYWYYSDLEPEDTNSVVMTAFIVNAVIVTIPFGLLPVLGNDFWNYFFCQFQTCNGSTIPFQECINYDGAPPNIDDQLFMYTLYGGYSIYLSICKSIYLCTYSSMIGLLLGVLYFILVPNDKEVFKIWWVRGRIVLGIDYYHY